MSRPLIPGGLARAVLILSAALVCGPALATSMTLAPSTVPLARLEGAVEETFLDRPSVQVTAPGNDGGTVVLLPGTFTTGLVEFDVAGDLRSDADPSVRGFVGLAFAAAADGGHYECVYLRVTNGRADSQEQRNHALQYISEPDYPWRRLRTEKTSQYESYADMTPRTWIHVRLEIRADRTLVFLNGAEQPALNVVRLRNAAEGSALMLWVGPGSVGHFHDVRVTPAS